MRRRSFIQKAGIATTGLAAVSSTAAAESGGATVEELGLRKRLNELYRQGKVKEAQRLLQKNGVDHGFNATARLEEPDDDGVSTDTLGGKRPKDQCDFYMSVVNDYDDVWMATGVVTLSGNTGYLRTAHFINDVCGFTYDSSEWTSIDATQDNATLYSNRDGPELGIEFDQYPAEKGLSATVGNVSTSAQDSLDQTIKMQTRLTRVDTGNDNIPVYFNYEHNWANSDLAGISNISFSLPFISVSLGSLSATAWSAKMSTEPGNYNNK